MNIAPPHEKGWRERKDSRWIVMCVTAAISTKESSRGGSGAAWASLYIYFLCCLLFPSLAIYFLSWKPSEILISAVEGSNHKKSVS